MVFIRLISGETASTIFFPRVGSTQEYTIGKAWNTTDFPNQFGRFTNTTSLFDSKTNRKASSWCLSRLSNPKTSHTFLNSSPAIFNTRLWELQAWFLRVTSSDMQGEMWLVYKSWGHGNCSHGSSSQTLFLGETSDNWKYICVRRLYVILSSLFIQHSVNTNTYC